jgi:voltage-gated potassium channel Kch
MTQVLLVGSDHLGLRLVEQLLRDGCLVGVLATPGSWLAGVELPAGVPRVVGEPDQPRHLHAAGLSAIDVLLAATDRDDTNLGVVLAARELRPALPVVLRQFNLRLGQRVARSLRDCEVRSVSDLSSTTFALAALAPGVVFGHTFGEQTLVLREVTEQGRRPLDVTLGPTGAGRLLVASSDADLPRHPHRPPSSLALPPPARPGAERRLVARALVALLAVVALASVYFHLVLGLSPVDALYFTMTTLTTVGFGDYSLRDASALSKLVGVMVMLSGVALTAVLMAFLTSAILSRQGDLARGRYDLRLKDHVVICGLGVVGYRVALALRRLGQPVAVVECDEQGRFVAEARRAGIPVVVGDALQEASLRFAGAGRARALVAATAHDVNNLEIALQTRELVPGLPVVLRLFDPDLSRRVQALFGMDATLSSAALAAGRFAALGENRHRLVELTVGDRRCELHAVPATAVSTVGGLAAGLGDALGVADARGRLRLGVAPDEPVASGDTVVVARLTAAG